MRYSLIFLIALGSYQSALADQTQIQEASATELVQAVIERTRHQIRYDGRYVSLEYPGGDVPADMGVCTDVVIRSYREIGIDLQVLVHEDMRERFGESLGVSDSSDSYLPGDIVTWMLPGNLPHIGIVIEQRSNETDQPLIVHNIGSGPVAEDVLFQFPITGHYRYLVN